MLTVKLQIIIIIIVVVIIIIIIIIVVIIIIPVNISCIITRWWVLLLQSRVSMRVVKAARAVLLRNQCKTDQYQYQYQCQYLCKTGY